MKEERREKKEERGCQEIGNGWPFDSKDNGLLQAKH